MYAGWWIADRLIWYVIQVFGSCANAAERTPFPKLCDYIGEGKSGSHGLTYRCNRYPAMIQSPTHIARVLWDSIEEPSPFLVYSSGMHMSSTPYSVARKKTVVHQVSGILQVTTPYIVITSLWEELCSWYLCIDNSAVICYNTIWQVLVMGLSYDLF